ncbi:hypothetical protein KEM56_000343 [Ascosphaera pollenicola]|nr:hypothetical protein KEM56_000343 [Ascosphaera pollenicola]
MSATALPDFIIIVGGGVFGLSTALALVERNYQGKITVVEAGPELFRYLLRTSDRVMLLVNHGLGKHIWAADFPKASEVMMQGLFISEMVYTFTMVSVKFSISLFYYRIFKLRQINIVLLTVCAIVTCWGFALVFVVCFQCVPLRGFWNKSINPVCRVNDYKFFIGNSVPNIATDVALLCIPIVPIWRLHVTTAQKITLTGLFMIGGLVTATSVVRLVYLLRLDSQSPDVTWNFSKTQIWTCIELQTAITSGTSNAPSGYECRTQRRDYADGKDVLLSDMQLNDGFATLSDVTVVHDVCVVSERISSQHNFHGRNPTVGHTTTSSTASERNNS